MKPGDDVIIAGSVPNDDARQIFGEWDEPKPYIRIAPQCDTAGRATAAAGFPGLVGSRHRGKRG